MIIFVILFTAWSLMLFVFGMILGTWLAVEHYENRLAEGDYEWDERKQKMAGTNAKEIKQIVKDFRKEKKAKIQEVIW